MPRKKIVSKKKVIKKVLRPLSPDELLSSIKLIQRHGKKKGLNRRGIRLAELDNTRNEKAKDNPLYISALSDFKIEVRRYGHTNGSVTIRYLGKIVMTSHFCSLQYARRKAAIISRMLNDADIVMK